jgi:hypothetical protein
MLFAYNFRGKHAASTMEMDMSAQELMSTFVSCTPATCFSNDVTMVFQIYSFRTSGWLTVRWYAAILLLREREEKEMIQAHT